MHIPLAKVSQVPILQRGSLNLGSHSLKAININYCFKINNFKYLIFKSIETQINLKLIISALIANYKNSIF